MQKFHLALTCDFQTPEGGSAYPNYDLSPLEQNPNVVLSVLPAGDRVLAEDVEDVDALISTPMSMAMTRASFPRRGRLALVARYGVGYDDVDVEAATENGVCVAVAADGVRRPMAVATLTLMLALTTRLLDKDRLARLVPDGWTERDAYEGVGLMEKTLGVIGLGNIGAEVVRLAAPLDMRFLAHDPYVDPALARSLGVELVDLTKLLADSDVVTIHCPLNAETRGLIDAERLATMKPTAFLINMARGPIVDQRALVEVLRARRIAGAGLDVLATEPPAADDPILTLDNVVLSPHALGATDECAALIAKANVAAVLDVMHGREPKGVVNAAVLEQEAWRAKLAAYRERFSA